MIQQIWRGRRYTQLMAKERNEYGPKIQNNVGVFQGSEISALLFIIYPGDVMSDCKELSANKEIPRNIHMKEARKNNANWYCETSKRYIPRKPDIDKDSY